MINTRHLAASVILLIIFLWFGATSVSGIQSTHPVKVKDETIKPNKPEMRPKGTYDTWIGAEPALHVSGPGESHGRISLMDLYPDGPAIAAGLRESDYILSINGQKIASHEDFNFIVKNLAPGTEVSILYERANEINTTKLKIAKKPHLPDLVNKTAPIIRLESYTDRKIYKIPKSDQQTKILYFMVDLWNTRFHDPFPEFKKILDAEKGSDIKIYGITLMTCNSTKFIYRSVTDTRIKEVECDEKRLSQGENRPYEIFYEYKSEARKLYLIEARPSIIVIDKENFVRFADILSDENIPKAIEVIRRLK